MQELVTCQICTQNKYGAVCHQSKRLLLLTLAAFNKLAQLPEHQGSTGVYTASTVAL